MKTIEQAFNPIEPNYPFSHLGRKEELLFLDIETTGFSARTSNLYLIGCAFWDSDRWRLIQWLAEKPEEEVYLLDAFGAFAAKYRILIHFNGETFDLPYLLHKFKAYDRPYSFDAFESVDLYKRISPLKSFLKLPNCRQKTLEQFLDLEREDIYSGGELIEIYHRYAKNPSEALEQTLLLHNADDMRGMLSILPMLAYYDLFREKVLVKKAQANYYKDLSGLRHQELLMYLAIGTALPKAVSASARGCYFTGEGERGVLRVPIYEEEMKFFYANYKDYYYLPAEDVALHRSVAAYVDKEYRIPASASNCYTRKYSCYLPQWTHFRSPFFKRDYQSDEIFFELTEELKHDRQAFHDYAKYILEMLLLKNPSLPPSSGSPQDK